jgi:hypothetical protein
MYLFGGKIHSTKAERELRVTDVRHHQSGNFALVSDVIIRVNYFSVIRNDRYRRR